MTVIKADEKGRIACRALFPPGTVFEAISGPGGKVMLIPMVRKPDEPQQARLVRQGGNTFLVSARTITRADVAAALEAFP